MQGNGMSLDAERTKLASRVMCLACASFLVTALIQGGTFAMVYTTFSAIPDTYDEFQHGCDNGDMAEDMCRQIRDAMHDYCHDQQPPLSPEQCSASFTENVPYIKVVLTLSVGAFLLMSLCCSACVPICGFVGAKSNSRGCTVCFLVMNILAAIGGAWSGIHGQWYALLTVILPLVSCYYAFKLQEVQNTPMSVRAPFMVAPPVVTAVQPQGYVPSAQGGMPGAVVMQQWGAPVPRAVPVVQTQAYMAAQPPGASMVPVAMAVPHMRAQPAVQIDNNAPSAPPPP